MITSLIEILELPNFGHMTTSNIRFVGDIVDRSYNFISFTLKYLYFKKIKRSYFC